MKSERDLSCHSLGPALMFKLNGITNFSKLSCNFFFRKKLYAADNTPDSTSRGKNQI